MQLIKHQLTALLPQAAALFPPENILNFNGQNVTAFLEAYEDMAKYYQFSKLEMIERITTYCQPSPQRKIRYSEEYSEAIEKKDWATFRQALRKKFRATDQQ